MTRRILNAGPAAVAAILCLTLGALAAAPATAETPRIRIAVLKFGTVNWLVDAITTNKLDEAEGYRLETTPLAGKAATTIAFQSGDADVFVTDWLWVMLQRERGVDYRFFPYSASLGALMSADDSGVETVCDLDGRTIGVVGGALDKSWLALQAYAANRCGFQIAERVQALYGAPPLLSRQLETGDLDAVLTFWPFAARLEAAGMRRVHGVAETLDALGVEAPPALVGFVFDGGRAEPAVIEAFQRSVRAAVDLLATDDAEWERIRPLMRVQGDAEFTTLRDHFRAGLVGPWSATDTAAADALLAILVAAGGSRFEKTTGPFDPEAFDVAPLSDGD